MSTYSLSGTGTHALTAGTTGLQVDITSASVIGGVGRSNPVAKYDQGLLRFSDGASYWSPVPILGGPQFIPVPANATSVGYALLGGAVVSVVEVIGGTVFFSAPNGSLATLSDVTLASLADGEILAWNASASKWENVTPSAGASLTTASAILGSDIALNNLNVWIDILSVTVAAGTWMFWIRIQVYDTANVSTTFQWRLFDGTTRYGDGEFTEAGNSFIADSSGVCIAVLATGKTIKLQATTTNDTNGFVKHAQGSGDMGNTQLIGLKVA